jgi:cell division protein FtsB
MKLKKPSTVIIFGLLIGGFILLLAPRVMQVEQLKARSRTLAIDLQKLQKENQYLENELRLLRDDPVYLEKVAREKFNKAKEGEIVYRVVRPSDQKN